MGQITGATNTQKTVMLSLAEGWMLRYVDLHGWCLFQPGRSRPFARVKKRTVAEMTAQGWLTPGIATKGLGYRPAKELTNLGRRYVERLLGKNWADEEEWDPFDHRAVKKGPKTTASVVETESSDAGAEPVNPMQFNGAANPARSSADEGKDEGAPHGHANGIDETTSNANGEDDQDEQPRFRLVA